MENRIHKLKPIQYMQKHDRICTISQPKRIQIDEHKSNKTMKLKYCNTSPINFINIKLIHIAKQNCLRIAYITDMIILKLPFPCNKILY